MLYGVLAVYGFESYHEQLMKSTETTQCGEDLLSEYKTYSEISRAYKSMELLCVMPLPLGLATFGADGGKDGIIR